MNNQMMNMLNQLRQNPMQILSKKFNLPQNLPNNPQEIIQYLLNTKQISQDQLNNTMQMKKQFFGN